jgi:pimeloyl-ACP methyl ester carboxylesterase
MTRRRPTADLVGKIAAFAAILTVSACSMASGAVVRAPSHSVDLTTPLQSPAPSASKPLPPASSAVAASGSASGPFASIVASDGVRQWLHCFGVGPLTLVVIPGLGTSAAAWSGVLGGFARTVRTCVYDRPGLGRSPARPDAGQVVDAGLLQGELWSLLQAAGQHGPYVVLGHSFGGLIARAFVAHHPSAVRGVLLAESDTPYDPSTGRYWTEAGHRVDLLASSAATGGGPPLGHRPLLVLSASNPDEDHLGGPTYGQPTWMTTLWVHQQASDSSLSSDGIQVVAHSGHVLQQDSPRAMIEAVSELVSSVRTGHALSCSGAWRHLGATCI